MGPRGLKPHLCWMSGMYSKLELDLFFIVVYPLPYLPPQVLDIA